MWIAFFIFVGIGLGWYVHRCMTRPRRSFKFTHEVAGGIIIQASDEQVAKDTLKRIVQAKMFGAFALVYDPVALNRELKKFTCEELFDENDLTPVKRKPR